MRTGTVNIHFLPLPDLASIVSPISTATDRWSKPNTPFSAVASGRRTFRVLDLVRIAGAASNPDILVICGDDVGAQSAMPWSEPGVQIATKPYGGIENQRPETIETIENFASWH